LTRSGLSVLLGHQEAILSGSLRKLGDDARVFYPLAAHREIRYEAALRDCCQHCKNQEAVILELKIFIDGRWRNTGPSTEDGVILLSDTPLWPIVNGDQFTNWDDLD
jgi:hypothetical protein